MRIDKKLMDQYAKDVSNWNKWGTDDEIGTLNYVEAEDIVQAASLVKKGKVFSLAIPLDDNGPQNGWGGRVNPVRTMMASGVDCLPKKPATNINYADDVVFMPLQCATHWDALGHVFWEEHDEKGDRKVVMWNGYPVSQVDSKGCHKCGIEKTKDKMVGRGVLLDVARFKGVDRLADGYGISNQELDDCAKKVGVEIKKGDFVIVRTGQLGDAMANGWGTYAAGDAPGLEFESLKWLHEKEVAAIATDTWGVEVRPNRSDESEIFQPWHWLAIPILGITMGEMFNVDDLADDCAQDGRYEFLLVAPPLPFTRGGGSPVNPMVIK